MDYCRISSVIWIFWFSSINIAL